MYIKYIYTYICVIYTVVYLVCHVYHVYIIYIYIYIYIYLFYTWPTKYTTVCHIWRPKLRGQFFKWTQQSKRGQGVACVTWICVEVFQLFFFLKYEVNIKNILIFKISKRNHLLFYFKKVLNCILESQKSSKSLSRQLYIVCLRGKM